MAVLVQPHILPPVFMELKQFQISVSFVCVLSALISTFAIVCRVWSRTLTRKKREANDGLMLELNSS